MYTKEFEVRWNDIDANRHLANSAYINYMSHTRLSFMLENGFGQTEMVQHNIGPVVFYEHMFYFKEVFPGKPIKVSLQLKGISEDGMYFSFLHNFYDERGRNVARCEMMGGWIDLTERKLRALPEVLLNNLNTLEKTEDFYTITKEDTRRHGQVPENLE
ncbi:acyl-CoA thioesterase [Marinirhabdus gelatinilytica]|uniref:Acyl-CoA thioester hydrolase n=1 Tax=Marinirhabdus gelatinilytica TaxID=1703343 RepID=A0A370QJZ9_9FLAO|nr:thioesterase family protein [Marinirhabdus gelatinilytica]RDK88656.1 acyl-CoA thioester hydrolase [Marinirhabdus gelatinilytica]